MNARDKGCRFPGCTFQRYVDGHHIQHWVHGGETKLSNLVSLCRFHHRLVHEGKVEIQRLDDGAFRFLRPNGVSYNSPQPAEGCEISVDQLVAANRSHRLEITPKTGTPAMTDGWMDYNLAVEWLKSNHARQTQQKNVSAETFSRPASISAA